MLRRNPFESKRAIIRFVYDYLPTAKLRQSAPKVTRVLWRYDFRSSLRTERNSGTSHQFCGMIHASGYFDNHAADCLHCWKHGWFKYWIRQGAERGHTCRARYRIPVHDTLLRLPQLHVWSKPNTQFALENKQIVELVEASCTSVTSERRDQTRLCDSEMYRWRTRFGEIVCFHFCSILVCQSKDGELATGSWSSTATLRVDVPASSHEVFHRMNGRFLE